jgi:hypothetical protein
MAKATVRKPQYDLKIFTDCMYFINGHCKLNDKCRYRHCQEAVAQTNSCFKWPKTCRDIKCRYRHPAPPPKSIDKRTRSTSEQSTVIHSPRPPSSVPQPRQDSLVSFFWDIENVPIPRAQKPFDIVQRIRQKLVIEPNLREYNFTCYCNSTTISKDNQLSLFHANVRIVHIPDRKPGAVDRQIMLELDRFERAHRPPATIVLISGDIDFVGKLSDLRHQAGFHVIVIHNKPAKEELKATVNDHYAWETFTQPQQLMTGASNIDNPVNELTPRIPQPYRMNTQNNTGNLRRTEPSPDRASATVKSRSTPSKKQIHRCPKCTNEFESIQALRQHQEAKDHLFDCPVCDECFTTLDGQTQHQKAKGHLGTGITCFDCNRHFTKLDSLSQHQQATGHNGAVSVGTVDPFGLFTNVSPPANIPKTNHQDAKTMIIEQGIEVLLQHLPKLFK